MSEYEEQVEGWEDEWAEAQANAGQVDLLPDGDYQAKIVEARVELADWGEWQLMVKYEDLASGGTRRTWDSLEHEVGRSIAAERTKKFGYEGTLAGLKKACEDEQFINLICDIRVHTKTGDTKNFTNVYINRCYGYAGTEGVPAGVAAGDVDDDIPF